MTELLDKAFKEASRLPENEQNEMAEFILSELKSEHRWAELLSGSTEILSDLARETRQEYEAGETEDFQPTDG